MELKRSGRNYGIDALRILSMFLVVMLHTLGHGGVLGALEPGSAHYRAAWLLETAAYCAVNCFALVSGFVGLGSRFRLSAIAALWLQVVFYHAIFTLAWAGLRGDSFGLALLAKAFQPVKNNAYWYYTAYFGISFLIPLVNAAVEKLDRRSLILCAAGMVLLFSIYPTAEKKDMFQLSNGYHALWLLVLYYLGACIRKLEPFAGSPKWVWALVYAGAVVLSWGAKMAGFPRNLVQYTSPTILLCALALTLLFSRLEFGPRARKVIALLSPLTFGVYLVHESAFVRNTLISQKTAAAAGGSLAMMLVKVLVFAVTVFTVSLGADYVRSILFRELKVKDRLDRLEKRLLEKIKLT